MIKLTKLMLIPEGKIPNIIHLNISADKVPSQYLASTEVIGGIKLVDYAKKAGVPDLKNGHYAIIKDNGKLAMKMTQKGKTRLKVVSRTVPDYITKITKVANSAFTDYLKGKDVL